MDRARKNRREYVELQCAAGRVQKMSPRRAVKFARALGAFVYYVIPVRKKLAITQCAQTFPNKSGKEIKSIVKRAFQNFSQTFIDLMRAPVRTEAELDERVVFHNEHLFAQAHTAGKGLIVVSGHFGNWEIVAERIAKKHFPLSVIAKKQRNRLVDDMVNSYRKTAGIETIPLGVAVRAVLKALRNNECLALLADQDAKHRGIFVDFLGRPSSTATGPATFALKTKAMLVGGASVVNSDGTYDCFFEEIPYDDLDGLSDENIRVLTQRYADFLDKYIRRYPDHWFWMHRRWKTQPPVSE